MVNQMKVYGQIFGIKKMSLQWKLINLFYLLAYNCTEKSLPYWSILQQFCRISFNHIGIEKYRYRNLLVPLLAISHINRVNCLYLVTADSFAEHHFIFTEMTKQIFWFGLSFKKKKCQTGIGRKRISETPPPRQKEWISIQKQDIEERGCVSFWKLVEQWTCSIWHWPQEQSTFIVFICFTRFKSFQGT